MCDLWPLLCSSKRFSTRWFYSGGGNSAGASSWKVHNLKHTTTARVRRYFGDQDNLHVHNLNVSIEQCLLFHVSVHNVSFTETNLIQCRDICNNDNIEHKSRIVKGCINSIVLYLWSIHLNHIKFSQPRSFIRLFHLFIIYLFLFTKFLFALIFFLALLY